MTYGSKEDLILNAMVGFHDLNDLQQLRMLARVPIISAYDPSTESVLAHASPSIQNCKMITGTCYRLPRDNSANPTTTFPHSLYLFLALLFKQHLTFIFTFFIILQTDPTTPTKYSSFILVLCKANDKRAQSCISGRQNLREYFFLPLAPHWVRHSYLSKRATNDPLYLWVINAHGTPR